MANEDDAEKGKQELESKLTRAVLASSSMLPLRQKSFLNYGIQELGREGHRNAKKGKTGIVCPDLFLEEREAQEGRPLSSAEEDAGREACGVPASS